MVKVWIFICGLFAVSTSALAQESELKYCLEWEIDETSFQVPSLPTPCLPKDTLSSILLEVRRTLVENGFLAASIDSVIYNEGVARPYLYTGKKFYLNEIKVDDETQSLLSSRTLDLLFESKVNEISPSIVKEVILKDLVDIGYLKAQVGLRPNFIGDTSYSITVTTELNQQFKINDLIIPGEEIVTERFLRQYLFWKKGETYNSQVFERVEKRINNLPFLKTSSSPVIGVEYDLVNMELRLQRAKANVFDFILGVLPSNDVQDRGLIFSVYLNTVLHNLLKQGERLSIKFINTRPETQELNIDFDYPYISTWPFGVIGGMQLYRNASTNIDLKYNLGITWKTTNTSQLGIYWERYSSSVLNPDTSFLIINKALPPNLDFITQRLGVRGEWSSLDDALAPKKGLRARVSLSLGQKSIGFNSRLLNVEVEGLSVDSLYNDLGENQTQWEVGYSLDSYIKLSQRWSLALTGQGKMLLSDGPLVQNELYRVGGNQIMRGFDEQFFQVSRYAIFTSELRFFLDRRSFFSVFADLGCLYQDTIETSYEGWVNGIGLGMNFETEVGLFNLSYAIGSGLNFPFNISTGRVHFGYVSLF